MRYSVYYFAGTKSAHVDKARVLVGKIARGNDGFGLSPFELLRRVRLKTQCRAFFVLNYPDAPPYAPLRRQKKSAARKQYQSILFILLSIDTTV